LCMAVGVRLRASKLSDDLLYVLTKYFYIPFLASCVQGAQTISWLYIQNDKREQKLLPFFFINNLFDSVVHNNCSICLVF